MSSLPTITELLDLPTATVGQGVGVSVEVIGSGARIIIGSGTTRP